MNKFETAIITKRIDSDTIEIEFPGSNYTGYSVLLTALGSVRTKTSYDHTKNGHLRVYSKKSNFLDVLTVLRMKYDTVEVDTEYNRKEKCNSSCQNASGKICQCSCNGKYHQGFSSQFIQVNPEGVLVKYDRAYGRTIYSKTPEDSTEYKCLKHEYDELLKRRGVEVELAEAVSEDSRPPIPTGLKLLAQAEELRKHYSREELAKHGLAFCDTREEAVACFGEENVAYMESGR